MLPGVHRIAFICLHTSPLAQAGSGDGGGMNVYVRELATALARGGDECLVFTRADRSGLPERVEVEPGFVVHYLRAGPERGLPKGELAGHVEAFTDAMADVLEDAGGCDMLFAHYWLSGLAAHALKHELELPLVTTFHTLARVKEQAGTGLPAPPASDLAGLASFPMSRFGDDPAWRADAEEEIVSCSDALIVSTPVEARQLADLYGADLARVAVVPPGVDPAYYGPGDQAQARRALGLGIDDPLLLFVGRIQPLKGAPVAVRVLASVKEQGVNARLVILGGPSGPDGESELARIHDLVDGLGLFGSVKFVEPQPHELLPTFYRAADVCLMPSRSESFGLVALESAACGVPVVASAVGGLTSLVLPAKTGMLVGPDDIDGFTSAVMALLTGPAWRREMGRRAVARARSYRWDAAAMGVRRICERLRGEKPVVCR